MEKDKNEMKTVPTVCPRCGSLYVLQVPEDEWANYERGMLIQRALRSLSAEDRERLITGICPGCWRDMFPDISEYHGETR